MGYVVVRPFVVVAPYVVVIPYVVLIPYVVVTAEGTLPPPLRRAIALVRRTGGQLNFVWGWGPHTGGTCLGSLRGRRRTCVRIRLAGGWIFMDFEWFSPK